MTGQNKKSVDPNTSKKDATKGEEEDATKEVIKDFQNSQRMVEIRGSNEMPFLNLLVDVCAAYLKMKGQDNITQESCTSLQTALSCFKDL